jgi:hypothetical protein
MRALLGATLVSVVTVSCGGGSSVEAGGRGSTGGVVDGSSSGGGSGSCDCGIDVSVSPTDASAEQVESGVLPDEGMGDASIGEPEASSDASGEDAMSLLESDAAEVGIVDAGGPCGTGALQSWPAADSLFRNDPSWLGADAAYSVDLGAGRILWLFGDSFIAKTAARTRSNAWFVRNSIAIQTGSADPSTAQATLAWRTTTGQASSFFPESGAHWFWPLGGVRLASRLVLFLLEEKSVTTGLGFESVGTKVVFVTNPDAAPLDWVIVDGFLPALSFPVALGAAVVRDGPYVYAFSDKEPGDHSVYLARFDVAALDSGDASSPLFYVGGTWVPTPASAPDVIFPSSSAFDNPPTEFSVQKRANGSWLAVHSVGFGATDIVVRSAPLPTGPWSRGCVAFTPPESGQPGLLVYAAKAHPELAGGSLVITYATNGGLSQVVNDLSLYFPRFVRVP